jgi:hypothetical protein
MAFAREAVLTALDTYLSRGGGSRGARAICDPDGSDVPITRAGPLKAFRFRTERKQDRAEKIAIRIENGAFTCSFQPVRRHDHSQAAYFERGWAEFLFTGQVRGRTLRMALHSKASQLARSEGSELGVLTSDRNACKTGQLTILNGQRVSNSIILPFN